MMTPWASSASAKENVYEEGSEAGSVTTLEKARWCHPGPSSVRTGLHPEGAPPAVTSPPTKATSTSPAWRPAGLGIWSPAPRHEGEAQGALTFPEEDRKVTWGSVRTVRRATSSPVPE
ncbi:MAG: hypothetical protein ACRDI0_02325 [Actinomycetota bacterium]